MAKRTAYWIRCCGNGWACGIGPNPPNFITDEDHKWNRVQVFTSRDALIAWLRKRLKEDAAPSPETGVS